MTNIKNLRSGGDGRRFIGAGVPLLVLGVVGVVVYASVAIGGDESGDAAGGVLQALTIIGAAVCLGAGAVLLATGMLKRKRAVRHIAPPSDPPVGDSPDLRPSAGQS